VADERIIAVGLLTARDVQLLGPAFERIWPVEEAPAFHELLKAMDETDSAKSRTYASRAE